MQKVIDIKFNIGDECFRYDNESKSIVMEKVTGIIVKKKQVKYKTEYCDQETCDCVFFTNRLRCAEYAKQFLTEKFKKDVKRAYQGVVFK